MGIEQTKEAIEAQDTNDLETPEHEQEEGKDTLSNLLRMAESVNLCDEIDDTKLTKIGRDVVKFGKLDDDSNAEWKKRSQEAMKLALQVVEEKNTPWPGASNVKYPLLTVAALQFHARCYPAVVSGNQVVKGQITGKDDDGRKAAMSQRIAAHMNWQLLEQDEDWEEDMDKLLLALPIEGCEFKKSFFSSSQGHNESEWVRPENLIVHSKSKSLAYCPRITHRLFFYPYEIDDKIRSGVWRDAELNLSTDDIEQETLQEFWEQHTYLDLDDDDYKEPYIITVHHKSQQVVRVVAGYDPREIIVKIGGREDTLDNFTQQAIAHGQDPRGIMQFAEFVRVHRRQMFTKYQFIPSPDGSFYDLGFGQLIGSLGDSIDTLINQLIDSGTLANRNGGFISDGVNIEGQRGNVTMTMGEFKRVKLPATKNIGDAILQLKFNEPSMVLFQLLGTLTQATKEITSIQDIMTGGADRKEAVGTAMLRVEQGMKVFSAIYKRIYRSLKQEFKKLFDLNAVNLQTEEYFRVLDTNEQEVVTLSDYRNDGTDVQPVSDPQLASNILAMAKAQGLLQVISHPLVNQEEVLTRYFSAMEVPAPEKLIIPPEERQAPPDPKVMLEAMKAADQHIKVRAEIVALYAKALSDVANAESKEAGTQLQAYAAGLRQIIDGWGQQGNDQGRGGFMAGAEQGSAAGVTQIEGPAPGGFAGLPGLGGPGPDKGGAAVGIPQGNM